MTPSLAARRRACSCASALLAIALAGPAHAGIDHRVSEDTGGIYAAQDAVPIGLGLLTAGCALWLGSADELGKTCWESGEAGVGSYAVAKGLQWLTARRAPSESSSSGDWFSGGSGSFPSGHVALTTAVVTPVMLDYAGEHPWVAALAVLPAYEMVARVKAREHWQTDVLGGALLGFTIGEFEEHSKNPLILKVFPGGAFIGFGKRFE